MSKQIRFLLVFVAGLALLAGALALGRGSAVAQDQFWRGEYYANPTLFGTSPAFVRSDPAIDFNWWDGSPSPQIPNDYFSVRWTKNMYFSGGVYRFAAGIDDGVRLYLDNNLIIDGWQPSSFHTLSKDVAISPGIHQVKMEYYEGTGQAAAALDITQLSSGGTGGGAGGGVGGGNGGDPSGSYPNWKGEYFTNQTLSGAPAVVRDDRYLDFDWGQGSPVPGVIPADYFSARWTKTASYPAGQYRLVLTSDDGARVYINGVVVLDNWTNPSYQPVPKDYWFAGGPATIRVDYYERARSARLRLDIIQVPGGSGVLPPSGYPGSGGSGGGVGGGTSGGSGGSGGGVGGGTSTIPQCPTVSYPTGLTAVTISPSNLNARREPTTQSEVIGQYAPCSRLTLTGYRDITGEWVETTLKGESAWVSATYLVMGTPLSSLAVK